MVGVKKTLKPKDENRVSNNAIVFSNFPNIRVLAILVKFYGFRAEN